MSYEDLNCVGTTHSYHASHRTTQSEQCEQRNAHPRGLGGSKGGGADKHICSTRPNSIFRAPFALRRIALSWYGPQQSYKSSSIEVGRRRESPIHGGSAAQGRWSRLAISPPPGQTLSTGRHLPYTKIGVVLARRTPIIQGIEDVIWIGRRREHLPTGARWLGGSKAGGVVLSR